MIVCPITSNAKGYPFEVPLPQGLQTHGVILADHVKSLDWNARHAQFMERVPDDVLAAVLQMLSLLLK